MPRSSPTSRSAPALPLPSGRSSIGWSDIDTARSSMSTLSSMNQTRGLDSMWRAKDFTRYFTRHPDARPGESFMASSRSALTSAGGFASTTRPGTSARPTGAAVEGSWQRSSLHPQQRQHRQPQTAHASADAGARHRHRIDSSSQRKAGGGHAAAAATAAAAAAAGTTFARLDTSAQRPPRQGTFRQDTTSASSFGRPRSQQLHPQLGSSGGGSGNTRRSQSHARR